MSVVFLFPGQGSQQLGMLRHLPDHPVVRGTLEEASCVLGRDILLLDTENMLASTVWVQIALLVAGVAAARALKAEGVTPDMVAGHSVGAFGAAVKPVVNHFAPAVFFMNKMTKINNKTKNGKNPKYSLQ